MFLFDKAKTKPVAAEDALPGRDQAISVPERHEVLGNPLTPPWPEGFQQIVVGMGCFWGAERVFWQADGVWTTAVGYAGGHTANPTYEEVCSARTGHTEAVLVVFDPSKTSYEEMLKLFWENHDPTQGMRQGNDVGTQYRSAILYSTEAEREAAERTKAAFAERLARGRLRRDHDRDRAPRRVLLRRGLPPAVPGEGPPRLLRPGRDRRELPDRARRPSQASRRTARVVRRSPARAQQRHCMTIACDRSRARTYAPGAATT